MRTCDIRSKTLTEFIVQGPFNIPIYKGIGGRIITDDNATEFWKTNSEYASKVGCYLFTIRAGRGYTPIYVGKATKSFKQEAFHSHKLSKYQQAMVDYVKGTPTMFFLCHPTKKGKNNHQHISKLEQYLIQAAVVVNPNLMNIQGTKTESWGIKGVLRSSCGQPPKPAKEFCKALNLKSS